MFRSVLACLALAAAAHATNWLEDYQQATQQATSTGRPLLLYFTGSDWCKWCEMLDRDVLESSNFRDAVAEHYICVKLDFPREKQQSEEIAIQNEQLEKRFDVRGFPTLLAIKADQSLVKEVDLAFNNQTRGFDAVKCAENIMALYQTVTAVKATSGCLAAQLEHAYSQAMERKDEERAAELLSQGLEIADNGFFLVEEYKRLSRSGSTTQQQLAALQDQIATCDPDNSRGYQYTVALVSFQDKLSRFKKGGDVRRVIQPLTAYLERFGANDSENGWRLKMTISKVLQSQGYLAESLQYAESSEQSAPHEVRAEIQETTARLRDELSNAI